jgi:hypothetical protein
MLDLHALAENHKEIPIKSWSIKIVDSGLEIGRVIKTEEGFNLISDYKNQEGFSSLMEAMNDLAETACTRRFN